MNLTRPCRRLCLAATLASTLATMFAGCTVGPNYHRPEVPMQNGWSGPTTRSSTQPTTEPTLSADALRAWWSQFKDPHLESLIARSIDSNFDLQQATSRLRQARASRVGTATGFYPTLDVNGAYARSGGLSDNNLQGRHDSYTANLNAAWEIDIFGGTRRAVEAADASVQAAVEDRRDVLVSLTAEVATNYVDLRTFQREIEIARGNLEIQRRTLDLTRQKLSVGFVGSLDVANAEASVASTLSAIPRLEASERQTMYTLAVLLGLPPAGLVEELSPHAAAPQAPRTIASGLPSDLLLRRPDVRRAEAQLHAATANVGVATADLFPRFALNGSLGTGQAQFGNVLRIANQNWSIGPSVSYPLFDAGRVRANIAIEQAISEQQLLAYKSTILTALQDVENALIAYDREIDRRSSLADAVTANQRAFNIATQLYSAGETDFLNVLTAQRSLFVAEDTLAQSDASLSTDLIALYRALGGGWSDD